MKKFSHIQLFPLFESKTVFIWHADSTAFPSYPKQGVKIQTSFASRPVYSISFLFPEEWIENSTLLVPFDTLTMFLIRPKSGLKIQLYRPFFALRYCAQVLNEIHTSFKTVGSQNLEPKTRGPLRPWSWTCSFWIWCDQFLSLFCPHLLLFVIAELS